MKHRVPTTSSGIAAHHEPVSWQPEGGAPIPRKIAICTSAITDRDRDPGADHGAGRDRRELEPAQQLALSPALERRGRAERRAHRHGPPEQAGGHELDRGRAVVLDPLRW